MKNSVTRCLLRNLNNEDGFLLIASILVLLVASVLAVAMSNTTITEIMIAGNDKIAQDQFFKADAGVNTVIAQNIIPNDSFLPANFPGNDFVDCNTPRGQTAFSTVDLDGDATNDVSLYFLSKSPTTPIEIEIASCAQQGDTMASIIAGLQYATLVGGKPPEGPLEH